MRKYAVLIGLGLFCTLLAGSGCKKYEDGPYLSFKSREARISNTWKVDNVYINEEEVGISSQPGFSDFTWKFSTDGSVSRTISLNNQSLSVEGNWALQSNDEEVRIVINSTLYSEDTVWVILRLMEDQFWVSYSVGKDVFELHLVPHN